LIEDIKYNLHEFDRFNYRRRDPQSKNKTQELIWVNFHFIGFGKKLIMLLLILLSHVATKTALSLAMILFLF
jgi:hypothetical protein